MTNNTAWLIIPKTNLHVGNENDATYSIIDKYVQRDILTGLPCIHASSLKGSLKEYFAHKSNNNVAPVFGSDKSGNEPGKIVRKGGHTFYDAHLLSIPVPGDHRLFYRAFCPSLIKQFLEKIDLFDVNIGDKKNCLMKISEIEVPEGEVLVFDKKDNSYFDDLKLNKEDADEALKEFSKLFNGINDELNIVLLHETNFKNICNDENLPIIARNKVETENEPGNLWYEQIIPSESIFYTFMSTMNEDLVSDTINNKIIQVGANATIGYGCCKFINWTNDEKQTN